MVCIPKFSPDAREPLCSIAFVNKLADAFKEWWFLFSPSRPVHYCLLGLLIIFHYVAFLHTMFYLATLLRYSWYIINDIFKVINFDICILVKPLPQSWGFYWEILMRNFNFVFDKVMALNIIWLCNIDMNINCWMISIKYFCYANLVIKGENHSDFSQIYRSEKVLFQKSGVEM